eukprot:PhF_6_TR40631/c0_g1_i1/m.60978/K07512/MECR, NRBF1; mitochondrial trans-2-enoyl-CoA reductase
MSKRFVAATGFRYSRLGDPRNVLQKEKYRIPYERSSSQCVVRMIAAPVHLHDKNMIQGTFGPIKPGAFPQVGGTEGVGIVEEVGGSCKLGLAEGDMVWINNPTVGTWASHIVTDENNLDVMPNRADIDVELLSIMSCYHTAYHLLNDFVQLAPGDVVLQTGATSTVSQITMSMARARGVKIFLTQQQGRAEHDLLHVRWKQIGAFAVLNYPYLRGNYVRRLLSDIPAPKLMLNHVGGLKASYLAKLMGDNGVIVSYGSALGRPLQLSNMDIIKKNLTFKGFFLPKWNANNSREKRMRIHQNIIESMPLAQGHTSSVRLMRYKFDTDSAFAFSNAFDSRLKTRKSILRMVGEYGEWRRPRPETITWQFGRAVWEDILQEMWESAACTETPLSMRYYTPFKDWTKDFVSGDQCKQMGHRDNFLRRPHMPRHNVKNTATSTTYTA